MVLFLFFGFCVIIFFELIIFFCFLEGLVFVVTAVLNGFRRREVLREQVVSLRGQSVPVDEILVWFNNPGDGSHLGFVVGDGVDVVYSSRNFGVWSRFFFALNASSEFVVVFDDDTVPGSRWVENCLSTMGSHEGLLGSVGLTFPGAVGEHGYRNYSRHGWAEPNEGVVEVDFVGHSWFFRREWLEFFVRDLPDLSRFALCGEDMHFSFMLQKYAGIRTFVPPHPVGDRSLWGSVKGREYGNSAESLWVSNPSNFRGLMDEFFRLQRREGWRLVHEEA